MNWSSLFDIERGPDWDVALVVLLIFCYLFISACSLIIKYYEIHENKKGGKEMKKWKWDKPEIDFKNSDALAKFYEKLDLVKSRQGFVTLYEIKTIVDVLKKDFGNVDVQWIVDMEPYLSDYGYYGGANKIDNGCTAYWDPLLGRMTYVVQLKEPVENDPSALIFGDLEKKVEKFKADYIHNPAIANDFKAIEDDLKKLKKEIRNGR